MTQEEKDKWNQCIRDYCCKHNGLYAGCLRHDEVPKYDHVMSQCMAVYDVIRNDYDVTIQMYDGMVNISFYNTSIEKTEIAAVGGEKQLMRALYYGLIQFIKTVST